MSATINQSSRMRPYLYERYPSGMDKKTKCKCRKLDCPQAGKIVIRCEKHLGKPSAKRLVCHIDAEGMLRRS